MGVTFYLQQTEYEPLLPLCVPECDSCAQTLLDDLEKLDDELARIKAQLDNASASATSKNRLEKLEKAVSDTKVTFQCSAKDCPYKKEVIFTVTD